MFLWSLNPWILYVMMFFTLMVHMLFLLSLRDDLLLNSPILLCLGFNTCFSKATRLVALLRVGVFTSWATSIWLKPMLPSPLLACYDVVGLSSSMVAKIFLYTFHSLFHIYQYGFQCMGPM